MIEIKPAKYLKPPKPAKERQKDSLVNKLNLLEINQNGKAASKYCDDQNMEFKIFTEKELGIY